MDQYLFQNCQKIVVFSADNSQVLLAKRKGEQDYDGVYTFIGGKMEISDNSLIAGMKREKCEEIGIDAKILIYPIFNHMVLFQKKDGHHMLIPHYYAQYVTGVIHLSDEYADYTWINIDELEAFEPKIKNIPEIVTNLLRIIPLTHKSEFVEI